MCKLLRQWRRFEIRPKRSFSGNNYSHTLPFPTDHTYHLDSDHYTSLRPRSYVLPRTRSTVFTLFKEQVPPCNYNLDHLRSIETEVPPRRRTRDSLRSSTSNKTVSDVRRNHRFEHTQTPPSFPTTSRTIVYDDDRRMRGKGGCSFEHRIP